MSVFKNQYAVLLKLSHIDWGRHRYTETRERIAGEGYVKIPRAYAVEHNILLGTFYEATFSDGFPGFTIRAAGNSGAGDPYAKQFQGAGDLKAFGRWYKHMGAEVDDEVIVTFIDDRTVNFELVKK